MENHPVEVSEGSGQLYYSDVPEQKQAVTWTRSITLGTLHPTQRYGACCRKVCSHWFSLLLLNLSINQIMPWALEMVSSSFSDSTSKVSISFIPQGCLSPRDGTERIFLLHHTLYNSSRSLVPLRSPPDFLKLAKKQKHYWKRSRRIMQKYMDGHAAGDTWRKSRLRYTSGELSPMFPKPLDKY